MLNIKVSIIIPIYNVEKYLRECLDSVVNQTLQDIEIICINDGSPDNSLDILQEYAKKDNRIVIINQKNLGVATARNNGINTATGEFVIFMDPDDFYPQNDVIELLYTKAKENNVVISGGEFSSYQNGVVNETYTGELSKYSFEKEGLVNYKDYQFDYGFHRFLYNRLFLIDNNIYFPNYVRFQDPPFFVKAMIKAEKFYAVNKVTYRYRFNHNVLIWTSKKVNHLIQGLTDNLLLSKQFGLRELHNLTIRRLTDEYLNQISSKLDVKNYCLVLKMFFVLNKNLLDIDLYKKYKKMLPKLLFQQLFSMRNEMNKKKVKHKIITILGISFKINLNSRKHFCPFCQKHYVFMPFGANTRANAQCSNCMSLERHRFLYHAYKKFLPETLEHKKILHMAPEKCIYDFFKQYKNVDYTAIDLSPERYTFCPEIIKADLLNLSFPSKTFDIILSNHVLEHLIDEELFFRSMHKILKDDGVLFLTIPMFYDLKETFEDNTITTDEGRIEKFGQNDHVRAYGQDAYQRFVSKYPFLKFEKFDNKNVSKWVMKKESLMKDTCFVVTKKEK